LYLVPRAAGKDVSPVAFDVDLEWNIKSFLPPALQIKFDHAIFVFLEQMYKAKRSAQSTSREPLRAIQPSLTQVSNGAAVPSIDPAKEKEVGLGRTIVGRKLTRLMLTNVQDILASQKLAPTHPEIADDLAFPLLPGAHLRSTNPALEFIKSTCHVFSLARELSTEVQVLKRNLLDFVGVREFADIAVFRNPCEVLKLPAVICTQCHSAKDLDLCRDPERLPQLVEMEDGDGRRSMVVQPPRSESWLCEKGHVLDSAGIEIRLVEFVQRLVLQYQLQDVRPLSLPAPCLSPACRLEEADLFFSLRFLSLS
jgi:DNA polymerase epsilon subunit 1